MRKDDVTRRQWFLVWMLLYGMVVGGYVWWLQEGWGLL